MNTSRLEIAPLGGIDERLPPDSVNCETLSNVTVDTRGTSWDNRIGYEKYFTAKAKYGPFNNDQRIQSLYCWITKGGARQYILYEAKSNNTGITSLKVLKHNPEGATNLEVGRNETTVNEPCTQYEPFGRYLIIVNGYDKPVKFDGDRLIPLGWDAVPGACTPWRPDVNFDQYSTWQFYPIVDQDGRNLDIIYGLGRKAAGSSNVYRYKISFLSETGSESPIGQASQAVAWETAGGADFWDDKRQAVHLESIPIGPDGTIARNIYRTLNLRDSDTEDELYYHVGTIYNNVETNYTDYINDSSIGALAPNPGDSIPFPSPNCRFAANFSSTLFIDGGLSQPTRIYYSNPIQPDSFAATNYFDVGTRAGGIITALVPYYNQLLVFRERAIDIIRRNEETGDFYIRPFQEGIGTKATNGMAFIPNIGLVFLAQDGVWVIQGGMDGGSQIQITKISDPVDEIIEGINPDVLARAQAAYSKYWDEWHVYFAIDGEEVPNRGLVFHLDKKAWSIREGFPVGALTVDQNDWLIFGNHTGKTTNAANEDYEAGLFVISGIRTYGYNIIEVQQEFITTPKAPESSKLRTVWHDFGNPNQKKFVKYVYLYVLTTGNNEIPITYRKDYEYVGGTASPDMKYQRAEYADQSVYGTAKFDQAASIWEKPLLTEVRYPVAQKACSHFQFEVDTANDFVIMGYSIEYTANNTKTRSGKR